MLEALAPNLQEIPVSGVEQILEAVSVAEHCETDGNVGTRVALAEVLIDLAEAGAGGVQVRIGDDADELIPAPSDYGIVGTESRSREAASRRPHGRHDR